MVQNIPYGGVAYIHFRTLLGSYDTAIIAARSKNTLARQIAITGIEMCAAALSCRLIKWGMIVR